MSVADYNRYTGGRGQAVKGVRRVTGGPSIQAGHVMHCGRRQSDRDPTRRGYTLVLRGSCSCGREAYARSFVEDGRVNDKAFMDFAWNELERMVRAQGDKEACPARSGSTP